MCSSSEYEGQVIEQVRRARAPRTCSECGYEIPVGVRHRVDLFVMAEEGDGPYPLEELTEYPETSVVYTHRECWRLAQRAADVVCNADVIPIGELEEHVAIAELALAGVDVVEEFGDEYENLDREKLPDLVAAWDAIEARYGGERDIGGSG